MKLYEILLIEYHIPSTGYGYWITDTGKILVVDTPARHVETVREFFKDFELSVTEAYIKALDAGWIRIVGGSRAMDIEAKKPTTPALAVLKQMTREFDEDLAARGRQSKYFVTKSTTDPTMSYGRRTVRDAWIDQPQAAANFFLQY